MISASEDILSELLTLRKEVDRNGCIVYYNNDNQIHRIHGPAIIWPDGLTIWCQNHQYHRADGPAISWPDGDKEWWEDGQLIRSEYCRTPVFTESSRL